MKNTEETKRSFSFSVEWGKLRERGKARKRRMLRQIELMRLRRIRQQNVPQYTYCKNCGTKLEGMYCYQCGQYALDPRQPFWKYFKQYFENVYQYDSKMWRTLWLMFTRPGLLTCEFNAGRINSYMHPFRLYMCVSVVFFTVIFMLTSELVNFKMAQQGNPELSVSLVERLKKPQAAEADTVVYAYHGRELLDLLASSGIQEPEHLVKVISFSDRRNALSLIHMPRILFDACRYHPVEIDESDLEDIQGFHELGTEGQQWMGEKKDVLQMALAFRLDSLGNALTPVYEWGEQDRNDVTYLRSQSFTNGLIGGLSKWTPFYMMFLLPLFAFLLKLFFRKKRIPYMCHFVHAIHLNTVLLLALFVLLIPYLASSPYSAFHKAFDSALLPVSLIFLAGLFIYLSVSFHTVYREGWGKTLIKNLLFSGIFTLLALVIATVMLTWVLYGSMEDSGIL